MVKNAFSVREAMDIAHDLMTTPVSRMLAPGDQHFALFRQLVNETGISGARLADAHIAALAIEHGATVVSTDRDFRVFDRIKLLDPLAG
jgi:predicted nucleic acid-binding protein